jgi:hypothetical protein
VIGRSARRLLDMSLFLLFQIMNYSKHLEYSPTYFCRPYTSFHFL